MLCLGWLWTSLWRPFEEGKAPFTLDMCTGMLYMISFIHMNESRHTTMLLIHTGLNPDKSGFRSGPHTGIHMHTQATCSQDEWPQHKFTNTHWTDMFQMLCELSFTNLYTVNQNFALACVSSLPFVIHNLLQTQFSAALETNVSQRNYSVAGLTGSWSHRGRNHIFYLIKIRLLLLCRFH